MPIVRKSIGSESTKNFKKNKEKKNTHKANQKVNLHANQEQEICLL